MDESNFPKSSYQKPVANHLLNANIPENYKLADIERDFILLCLRRANWVRDYACILAGISRRNLLSKIALYKSEGIEVCDSPLDPAKRYKASLLQNNHLGCHTQCDSGGKSALAHEAPKGTQLESSPDITSEDSHKASESWLEAYLKNGVKKKKPNP